MSEQHVYIYVRERDHVISDEQKEKAFSLFDENIIECEHEPYFVATNRFWQLDDNDNEEFESDINETISIRPKILQELENILGTKVAVVWEHRD